MQPDQVTPKAVVHQLYWDLVRACLVEFHQRTQQQARQEVAALRSRLAGPAGAEAPNLIYHSEAFNLACVLAGTSLSLYEHRAAYAELRERLQQMAKVGQPKRRRTGVIAH